MFIGDVLTAAGIHHPRYATALLDAASAPLYRGRAPAGSLVFFDQRIGPDGHVGIALGDGTMLSALNGGVVRTMYEDWPSYRGWRPGTGAAPVRVSATSATSAPTSGSVSTPTGAPPRILGIPSPTGTSAAATRVPRRPVMELGGAAISAGMIGLSSDPGRWSSILQSSFDGRASPADPVASARGDPAPRAGVVGVTSGGAGLNPFGGSESPGAVIGRGTAGATPVPGERLAGRWRAGRAETLLGAGGAALLLLAGGLGLLRREARLAAGGRRL